MVERPAHSFKKRVGKLLVYPDGRNRCAHIGLVDNSGVMLYMLDTESSERFDFAECNELLQSAEAKVNQAQHDATAAIMERDAALSDIERALLLVQRSQEALDDALDSGKFPRGEKTRLRRIHQYVNTHVRYIQKRWPDGQLSDGR